MCFILHQSENHKNTNLKSHYFYHIKLADYLVTVTDDINIKKREREKKEHSNILKLKEASCVHGKIVLSCDEGICCHLMPTVSNTVEKKVDRVDLFICSETIHVSFLSSAKD